MIDRLTRPSAPRGRIAAAAAAAALLLAPSTAAAEGWLDGPAFELGLPVSAADFGAAPDGSSTAAWIAAGGLTPELRVQHAAADGALGPVQSLGAANAASAVVVATAANGRGAVLWAEPADGGETDLKLALLAADGTAAPAQTVGTLATPMPDPAIDAIDVAVDADGDATVAWWGTPPGGSDDLLQLRRVAADGTLGAPLPVAAPASDVVPQVVAAPTGTAWVAWNDGDAAHVARLDAAGAPAGFEQVSAPGEEVDELALATGGGGAALAWEQYDDGSASHVQGVRLPASGALAETPFHSAEEPSGLVSAPTVAVGADGTTTVAWTGGELAGPTPTMITRFARIAPGASTAAAQTLVPSQPGVFSGAATLGAAPDGSLLAAWVEARAPPVATVSARRIAPDGTLGPIARAGDALVSGSPAEMLRPFPDADGGALLAIRNPLSGLVVRSLDAIAPVVTVDVPVAAVVGVPVQLSSTVTDRTGVDLWWDFGDESGSRRAAPRHAFAAPGAYAVTLTATDAADNATTVTRQIVVTAPGTDPGPRPDPRRPQPAAPAALKIARTSRAGAKVTVAGTIARAASGRVTIAVSKRVGRRTVTVRTSARIAGGRWGATVRLTRALAKARGSVRVVVRYAGDEDVRAASATRTVRAPRAGKPKPKKGKR